MNTVLSILIGLSILTGCMDFTYKEDPTSKWKLVDAPSGLYRIVDKEFNIVCYSLRGGAINCVKDTP